MSTNEPETLATEFYEAFARRDSAVMAASYADDATFSDPVFPALDAGGVRAMWTMLLSRAKDLAVTHELLGHEGNVVRLRWTARYTFSQTGRPVVNVVTTTMTFAGGRITHQVDEFDFWRWSRQALGLPGMLLGWTPMLRAKVQGTAAEGLAAFRAKR